MTTVHIYAPPATSRFVLAMTCPDCGKRTRMLGWDYEWHGATVVCLRCGREWQDGEWMALPFMRGARQHNIYEAKARWRRFTRAHQLMAPPANDMPTASNQVADVHSDGPLGNSDIIAPRP